jgi:hypothetical protein
VALMEREYKRMVKAVGWLAWHMSRWKDIQSGHVVGEQPVWNSKGWAQRFGLPAEAAGFRDTPHPPTFWAKQVLLLEYAEAAHQATVRHIGSAIDKQLMAKIDEDRRAWQGLQTNALDYAEHSGQIMYLRGVLASRGSET